MFHIDATFEDIRIIAQSQEGHEYDVILADGNTGKQDTLKCLSASHLAMIFAFNLDINGEPEGFEQFYAALEPVLAHLPRELRPIP